AVMLLTKFHLNIKAASLRGGNNRFGFEIGVGESLTAFDSRDANIRTQIQVGRKFTLRGGNFKRSPSSDSGDAVTASKTNFLSSRAFVRNHPASHRYFKYRHQMGALL